MVTKNEFAVALAHLCALKRTANFSSQEVAVWYGGLSSFPAWIVNKAVLAIGVSADRFPEFGDLYRFCREEAIRAGVMKEQPYSPNGAGEKKPVTTDELMRIGSALGLVVSPPCKDAMP